MGQCACGAGTVRGIRAGGMNMYGADETNQQGEQNAEHAQGADGKGSLVVVRLH